MPPTPASSFHVLAGTAAWLAAVLGRKRASRWSPWDNTFTEGVPEGRCLACHAADRATGRYFEVLFYEAITDPVLRSEIRAANGFCPRHMETLRTYADPLGASILLADLLETLAHGVKRSTHACPACRVEADAVVRVLSVLGARLDVGGPTLSLCWPHLQAAVSPRSPLPVASRRRMLAAHARWWNSWRRVLAEVATTNNHVPLPDSALTLWRTVADYLAGALALPVTDTPSTDQNPPSTDIPS